MAESILRLYKTEITPQRNAWVDDLPSYLSDCGVAFEVNPFQYQKIELDKTIKIAIDQYWSAIGDANYCSIEQDGMTYYYFILSAKWSGVQCVTLSLSIDSVNTFGDMIDWSEKTTIIREHVDRFTNIQPIVAGEDMKIYRKIDDVDEGLNGIVKIKTGDDKIQDNNIETNQKWYLVYKTPNNPTETSPVDCLLVPEKANSILYESTSSSAVTWNPSDFEVGYYYYWLNSDNSGCYFMIGTQTYVASVTGVGYVFYHSSNGLTVWSMIMSGTTPAITTTKLFNESTTISIKFVKSNSIRRSTEFTADLAWIQRYGVEIDLQASTAGKKYLQSISTIDRTQSTLLKIIACPYCPININFVSYQMSVPDGWEITPGGYLKLSDLNKEFKKTLSNVFALPLQVTLSASTIDDFKKSVRNSKYEAKLYNSDFFTLKVTYDSFYSEIQLEKISAFTLPVISIEYKQSNGIVSDCGFRIDSTSTLTYKGNTDYDLYLISTRNNETPIYTNDYLNYLRTGYNYDRKNQVASNVGTWLGAGMSLAGAVASFAASGVTGGVSAVAGIALTASAATTLTSAVTNTVKQEQSIQQKIDEKKAQASQVAGSNDLNIMNWYNGNKLHVVTYSVTDKMKQVLSDLFHYCGYARNMQGIPDFKSRYWFNYVQCNAVFKPSASTKVFANFQSDLKTRFAAGVTRYHRNGNAYDWDQEFENWEVGFFS